MKIGIPKETLIGEYRVSLLPEGVAQLVQSGMTVYVESGAGLGVGKQDSDYERAGATVVKDAKTVYSLARLIVKVKEPTLTECGYLNAAHIVFAYLHLAAYPELVQALLKTQCTAIAYETVRDQNGRLPLLAPMSEIAGCLAVQMGAQYLTKHSDNKGRGILLGGIAGIPPAKVLVLGGGTAGAQAIRTAIALQAQVTVIEHSLERLKELHHWFSPNLKTLLSSESIIREEIKEADLIIGTVLLPGRAAPKLVSRAQLQTLKPGTVLVDVSIDQGGCFESSIPTSHKNPTCVVEGIVHVGVTNLPGCVPHTSTVALMNATLPCIMKLANHGLEALLEDEGFRMGLNLHHGQITHPGLVDRTEHVSPTLALRNSLNERRN